MTTLDLLVPLWAMSTDVNLQMPWGLEATPTWPGHQQQQKAASTCWLWGHLCMQRAGPHASSSLVFLHFQSLGWGAVCSPRTQARVPSRIHTRGPRPRSQQGHTWAGCHPRSWALTLGSPSKMTWPMKSV